MVTSIEAKGNKKQVLEGDPKSIALPYQEILQTPSITASGRRWQQKLANTSSSTLATALSQETLTEKDVDTSDQSQKRAAAIKLLISWREDDEQEQKETLEYLQRALEEDRPSDRKLFP